MSVIKLPKFLYLLGFTFIFITGFYSSPAFSETKPDGKSADDVVMRGDAACVKCHDEDEAYPVLAIGKTRHGVVADARTPTCTTCHGESTEHIKKLIGDEERVKPDITFGNMYGSISEDVMVDRYFGRFGKGTTTPVEERNKVCLGCHQKNRQMFWQGSTHANRDIGCTNCHQVHTEHDRVRDTQSQTELCFSCHKEQRAQMHRPNHHPVLEGEMSCSSCHNAHGSAGPKQLVKDSVNETCYTCHMEKRGPFVHSHQPVTEDCSICHNPHGTTVPRMLKARSPYLCQECHSWTRHPTGSPRIPGGPSNGRSDLNSVARGCLNCHTNIHGSNSSQNLTAPGRLVR